MVLPAVAPSDARRINWIGQLVLCAHCVGLFRCDLTQDVQVSRLNLCWVMRAAMTSRSIHAEKKNLKTGMCKPVPVRKTPINIKNFAK